MLMPLFAAALVVRRNQGPLGPRSQVQAKTEPDGCGISHPNPDQGWIRVTPHEVGKPRARR